MLRCVLKPGLPVAIVSTPVPTQCLMPPCMACLVPRLGGPCIQVGLMCSLKQTSAIAGSTRFRARDYVPPPYAIEAIKEEEAQLRSEVDSLLKLAETVPTMFPDLLKGSDAERVIQRTLVESAIANDMAGIREMYSSFIPLPGAPALPPAQLVDQRWALYRWLQVRLLFVVDIYCRYGGNVPQHPVGRVFEKLEHDLHDAQYLVLGVLEGRFATREKKLQRWFSLLCPERHCYS